MFTIIIAVTFLITTVLGDTAAPYNYYVQGDDWTGACATVNNSYLISILGT